MVPGIVPSQVQDFVLPLVELHEVSVSPFLQPVEVPLYGSTTLLCMGYDPAHCWRAYHHIIRGLEITFISEWQALVFGLDDEAPPPGASHMIRMRHEPQETTSY